MRYRDHLQDIKIQAKKAENSLYLKRVEERRSEFYSDIPDALEDTKPFYFVFDVETNGLPDYFDAPVEDLVNWPHPLSVAYLILTEELELVRKGYYLLNQDCKLESEALEINGLSEAILKERGKDPKEVHGSIFKEMKECKRIVGHNLEFDIPILQADFIRHIDTKVFRKRKICTMKKSTALVAIPRAYGNGYKWPKLSELVASCFFLDEVTEGFEFEEAHDALWDATATAKCFIYLVKHNEITV